MPFIFWNQTLLLSLSCAPGCHLSLQGIARCLVVSRFLKHTLSIFHLCAFSLLSLLCTAMAFPHNSMLQIVSQKHSHLQPPVPLCSHSTVSSSHRTWELLRGRLVNSQLCINSTALSMAGL